MLYYSHSQEKGVITMTIVNCSYCDKEVNKPAGDVNRSKKIGAPLFCDKKCSGLGRRLNKTKAQLIEDKRLYDLEYRNKNKAMLKAKKAEAFKRNYDPVKAAVKRKERAHLHVEYCRRPEYRAWKKKYDRVHRAKKDYGDLWEIQILAMEIQDEVESRMDKQTIRVETGVYNKSQRRKRYERSNSKKLENRTMGHP